MRKALKQEEAECRASNEIVTSIILSITFYVLLLTFSLQNIFFVVRFGGCAVADEAVGGQT